MICCRRVLRRGWTSCTRSRTSGGGTERTSASLPWPSVSGRTSLGLDLVVMAPSLSLFSATPGNDRKKMLEFRRQRRSDSSLEKAARERTLEVDLDDVRRVYRESGALYVAIRSGRTPMLFIFLELLFPQKRPPVCIEENCWKKTSIFWKFH